MTVVSPGAASSGIPDGSSDQEVARIRRRRLWWVLTVVGVVLVAAALVALLLPAMPRRTYLVSVCVAVVLCGALPSLAALLQYAVIGLHRFRIGYEALRPCYPRVAILVPAWNEAAVIGNTIERLLAIDYPADRVRVYVIDDASTDATPDVVRAWSARVPDRVRHLRREKGGQGKSHTLNHGITQVLAEPWAEAVLIIDADVLFADSALRRMTRHLSRPEVGAVTAYIKEGTRPGNYLTRFIGYEYITAQAASRRAQNVFGTLVCLAGGAQLHSRENLCRIGGRIDTTSLAEDTTTTFLTQLSGKRVVFEGNAVVWAEEPSDLVGLWKQRLRWARGNVQLSLQFSRMWLRGRRYGGLGGVLFALTWFTVLLTPVCMTITAPALIGLHFIDAQRAWGAFRLLWVLHAVGYIGAIAVPFALDRQTARHAWLQGLLFPGLVSLGLIVYSLEPRSVGAVVTSALEFASVDATPRVVLGARLVLYGWAPVSMVLAYLAKAVASRWRAEWLAKVLVYLAGYGAFLGAVTCAAYVREIQGARLVWDKTIKTGKVAVAP